MRSKLHASKMKLLKVVRRRLIACDTVESSHIEKLNTMFCGIQEGTVVHPVEGCKHPGGDHVRGEILSRTCIWDGTLSPDDFRCAAIAFSERWKDMSPTLPRWMWISQPMSSVSALCKEEGYLSLENIYHPRSSEDYITSECCPEIGEENVDCATLVQNDNQQTHIYDYHIVYSFSFKVPVLYFRGYRYDGQPLHSDEIQRDLPSHSLGILKESKWTYMTQEDHPFLHRPWFMLHPCGTRDWMKLLFSDSQAVEGHVVQQYLPSWLSVVGQAVGLRIPLEMQNKSSITSLH